MGFMIFIASMMQSVSPTFVYRGGWVARSAGGSQHRLHRLLHGRRDARRRERVAPADTHGFLALADFDFRDT